MVAQFCTCYMVKKCISPITVALYPEKALQVAAEVGIRGIATHELLWRGSWRIVGNWMDSCNPKGGWSGLLRWNEGASRCLRCVHFVNMAPFSWAHFLVLLYCFLQTKLHISKCNICMMFKSFPNTSIRLENICVFKTSLKAEQLYLHRPPGCRACV